MCVDCGVLMVVDLCARLNPAMLCPVLSLCEARHCYVFQEVVLVAGFVSFLLNFEVCGVRYTVQFLFTYDNVQ
jgi:hypothetical protein